MIKRCMGFFPVVIRYAARGQGVNGHLWLHVKDTHGTSWMMVHGLLKSLHVSLIGMIVVPKQSCYVGTIQQGTRSSRRSSGVRYAVMICATSVSSLTTVPVLNMTSKQTKAVCGSRDDAKSNGMRKKPSCCERISRTICWPGAVMLGPLNPQLARLASTVSSIKSCQYREK
jgi:hypothetical protein